KEAHRRMLWLVEDCGVVAQSAASRNVEGGLDLHVRLCGLQPGAHAKPHGRHSSGAVSPGRSVCEWRRDDHSGASVGEKSARKTTQGSQMVTRGQKFVIQTRIFSSLLGLQGFERRSGRFHRNIELLYSDQRFTQLPQQ